MKLSRLSLLIIFSVAFLITADLSAQQEIICTDTVSPNESLQLSIDVFGFSPDAIICLEEGTWNDNLTIRSSLTLVGIGASKSIIKALRPGERIVRIDTDNKLNVKLQNIAIRDAFCTESSSFTCDGVIISGDHDVVFENVLISSNRQGIFIGGTANVHIIDSTITDNSAWGINAWEDSSVIVERSTIEENIGSGISLVGSAKIEIVDSFISRNGLRENCQQLGDNGGTNCVGILLLGNTNATIQDSIIVENVDWGISGWHTICQYDSDSFVGSVQFLGNNEIRDNNSSSNHLGMGNPGVHPFADLPDGQVCLP